MSRIIIKNLPKGIKDERLRKIFGEKGFITDCSLKYTKEGKFRKFAFIGYRTDAEADDAIKHLNNTFIDTSRIKVEQAKDLGDLSKPRAWSKYSKDSSAFGKQQQQEEGKKEDSTSAKAGKSSKKAEGKASKVDKLLGELKDDPEFQEFLDAHEHRTNKSLWSNDAGALRAAEGKEVGQAAGEPQREEEEVMDESNMPTSEEDSDEGPDDPVSSKKDSGKALTDLEYLKSKVSRSSTLQDSDSDNEGTGDESTGDESSGDDETGNESADDTEEKRETSNESDKEEENNDFRFLIKMRGLPPNVKESQVHEFFKPVKIKSIKIPRNAKGSKTFSKATVELRKESDLEIAMRKNKNFIGAKKIFLHKMKEKVESSSAGKSGVENKPRPWELKDEDDDADESIAETGRLYVRNLAYCCKEEDLEAMFSKYGPLTEAHLPIDSLTKKIKGFAFITYMIPENAVKAYTELDGKIFQGRMFHILPAKPKKEDSLEITDNMSHKQKKEIKQKKNANSAHSWNTLFLGANTVADVMAEKYGTSKDAILSAEGKQSLGVRMALGETQVVKETRDFLMEQGVALDSFSQPSAARSKTVILVKNLPAGTQPTDIRDLFARYGTLGRVLLPPSGVTAIVEFAEPTEARSAFRGLAYTKFQHVPLYLEWAPMNVFTSPAEAPAAAPAHAPAASTSSDVTQDKAEGAEKDDGADLKAEDTSKSAEQDSDSDGAPIPGCTLFVKNLNFESTETSLKEHFTSCGKVRTVSIAKKKDMKNPGAFLSMGYGFVEYKAKESADKALKRLQHSQLDGHQLELKISNRATVSADAKPRKKQDTKKKQTSTKIIVRNVPFEAKPQELRELFSTFGELTSVRMPKKMSGTGSHRGFGFVDFVTKEDAKRAFDALCHSTHLYGRRLVLEWADTEESVDQLRKKTADHYFDEPTTKRLKKAAILEDLKGGDA